MRLRTLGAVCASCAAAAPSPAFAADPTPAPASTTLVAAAAANAVHVAVMRRLVDRHMSLEHRRARLLGDHLSKHERRHMRDGLHHLTPAHLRARTSTLRRDIGRLRRHLEHRYGGAPDVPIPGVLEAIARCESGGDPRAVSSSGIYRGKYQFSFVTWHTVGGSGDPAQASETEQDRRAALLYRRSGAGQWPVCGR
jgi:hypothetical protein